MQRLEFERAAGCKIWDEEWKKIELIYMNTDAITSVEQMVRIYVNLEREDFAALYSLVMERGKLIETVGQLRTELSSVRKETRSLKRFRDAIINEAERNGAKQGGYRDVKKRSN